MIRLVCAADGQLATLAEQREAAAALLARSLEADYGITAGPADMVRGRWGKPALKDRPDIHFSLAHCAGGVACVTGACRNGIDIERVRPFDPAAARKALSAGEQEALARSGWPERDFFRFWTLKESYLKALGTGLALPLAAIGFSVAADAAVTCSRRHCRFRLLESPAGFVAAVCLLDVRGTTDLAAEPVDWQYLD